MDNGLDWIEREPGMLGCVSNCMVLLDMKEISRVGKLLGMGNCLSVDSLVCLYYSILGGLDT